jgi:predicted small lipoprotein YifL
VYDITGDVAEYRGNVLAAVLRRGATLTDCAVAANDCRLMSRSRSPVAHRAVVVVLLALAACGKKGPPLAPLRVAPGRIEDLAVTKTGDEVRARFTVPATNADQTKPADLAEVEVYAISGKPEDPAGNPLPGPQFIRFAELVGRVEVAPPEIPGEEPPDPTRGSVAERARAAAELAARQAQPAQGSTATVVERLTRDDYTPFVHPERRSRPPAPPATTVLVRPLGPAPAEEPFSRTYIAVAVSRHGTQSALSNRVAVPLADAPDPPSAVTVTHAETSATIAWTPPSGTARSVQRPAEPGEIAARSLAPGVVPTTYNVYRVARSAGSGAAPPLPVNPTPVEGTAFTQSPITLGEEGCYQVRAVRVYGHARLESAPSETACTTFMDTFPPPPPANLAAVGSEGGVSLIWDPSPGSDVAGYLVLRGEIGAAGLPATLAPLTPQPIRESTYRDDTARRGARYVYAVVAIDGASPPNRSVESNRVEEGAR